MLPLLPVQQLRREIRSPLPMARKLHRKKELSVFLLLFFIPIHFPDFHSHHDDRVIRHHIQEPGSLQLTSDRGLRDIRPHSVLFACFPSSARSRVRGWIVGFSHIR